MIRKKKTEQIIGRMKKEMGFSNEQIIAWLIYRDGSEKAQKRVRAILSYMKKKKALLNDSSESGSMRQQTEHNSFVDIVSRLRRRKNFTVSRLWSKGYPVGMIALLLYGDESKESQNRVYALYAHISKFRKSCGCDFPEQNLRSRVAVVNFPNKTCDFEPQPQPQPKPELERMISSFCNGGEAIPTV